MSLVLAATIGVLVQVGIQGAKYFDYETTANVKFEFAESLQFPAVTICNYNTFR